MKSILTSLICLLIINLSAQEWIRQNPYPIMTFMQGITMNETGHGWAVGGDLILQTPDFGNSWFPQEAPIPGWVIQTVAAGPNSNNQRVIAGGNSIIYSENGGEDWNVAEIDGSLSSVKIIDFINENDAYAIGIQSAALSTDGGQSWSLLPSLPDINSINAGHFLSADVGFLVGPGPDSQIYKTTNGGQSWDIVDEMTIVQFADSFQFLDDQTGYIFGRDFLFKTTDGGDNWEKTHPNVIAGSITGGYVVNENLIYLVTNNASIYTSEDGGATWTQDFPNLPGKRFKDVLADETGRIWIAAQFSSILFSNNNGVDWLDQVGGNKNILRDIGFKDENLGIAVGNGGTILRTADGGAIWEDISIDPSSNFFGMHFKDEENIWMCGSQGRVFKGSNNATQYTEVSSIGNSGNEIHAVTNSTIVVADEDGNLYRSMDAGASWNSVYSTSGIMSSVYFFDEQQGYAAGEGGVLLTSSDGGANWTERINEPGRQFVDIFPSTNTEVWAMEYRGDSIWHSADKGISWEQINIPITTFWAEITFMNKDIGWICGGGSGSGRVIKTIDGGMTWALDHSSQGQLGGMDSPVNNEELAWAVGSGGNIVKFSQCNFAPTISNLSGEVMPCEGDTVSFQIDQENVTNFEWDFPGSWLIIGNPNSAKVDVVAGFQSGLLLVKGLSECGESETLELFINPTAVEDAVIEQQGDDLVSLTSGVSYQWYTNQGPINGANSSTFTPTETGTYFVRVTFSDGCTSKASNVINVTISGVQDLQSSGIRLYPNPSAGIVHIEFDESIHGHELSLDIFNMQGRELWNYKVNKNTGANINLPGLASGLYLIMIKTGEEVYADRLFVIP
jgi:photosystem II stability/assembly factor-like uncharacterized protein